jgi:hypothetical protein
MSNAKYIEYTVAEKEIKFKEEESYHPIGTNIHELAEKIGYGKIIDNGEIIKAITKTKI